MLTVAVPEAVSVMVVAADAVLLKEAVTVAFVVPEFPSFTEAVPKSVTTGADNVVADTTVELSLVPAELLAATL